MLFDTEGSSRRLNQAYFLKTRNTGHRKDLYPRGTHRVLLCFTVPHIKIPKLQEDIKHTEEKKDPCSKDIITVYQERLGAKKFI